MNGNESLVQWHEGMLISPQHFQQSINYAQMITAQMGAASGPFHYGLFELKIDTSSLASGLVRVLKASGFFPDGLFFDFDATKDQPLELNLSSYFSTTTSATKIYLAVPSRQCGENILEGAMARYYSSEITDVKDENTGENAISIPTLKPNLKLLQESQVDGRYQSFPIIEVEKSVEGGIISTHFVASFLSLNEQSSILGMCREVAEAIRKKIAYFADRKDNFSIITNDESLSNLRLLIQAALPLESIIKTNGLHPFEIFKSLLHTTAAISAVNPYRLISKLPSYNHKDIYSSFEQLCTYSMDILSHLKQKYDVVKFEKAENNFLLNIKPEWLTNDEITIGIQKPFSVTNDEMLQWISGLKIASESMMSMIKDKRVLGADRRILERGEYLTQPTGMTAVAIKAHTYYIKPNEKLCLCSSASNITPEEIILYAERQ